MSTTLVTNMYKPRGLTYYSASKDESFSIPEMNYMHLSNAIRAIEDQARDTKKQLRDSDPEAYKKLEGLTLPALAATLCPQYLDLVDEYSKRNKDFKPMSETTTQSQNQIESLQQNIDDLTVKLNTLKTNALNSLETVRQLAPSSVVSDLDDIAKFMDEMNKLFELQTKKTTAQTTVATTTEQTTVEVAEETVQAVTTLISDFNFSKNHQVNIGVKRKIGKYLPDVETVGDFANYSLMDMLTLFTGEQVYNIALTLVSDERGRWFDDVHSIYSDETDQYPQRIEHFIKKPRFDRAGFEKKTNTQSLRDIGLINKEAWIKEADRIHNNIADRARERYKILSNYAASYFDKKEEQGLDAETWIDNLLEDCSQLTRDEVLKWFYKGTI